MGNCKRVGEVFMVSCMNNKNFNFLVFLGVPMVIMELFVIKISTNVKFLVCVYVMEMENVSIQ